ncbi:pilus assembly protein [Thermomicrobium sp. 4228-Ro]|uniref:TadE/TadG family type IV pilus assembly protein n=1 Tax=Thermomicrobium sp. 4228-Ro TaxID=2993937 RepID=UPI002248F8D1|nr:TadE/TadG family type IV pilus assembly protein [Thermomicrobium sp. 4228-Ro]MCX2727778.1 pilus assembly protein [Thermomicrobium sp. 4228-Ro]
MLGRTVQRRPGQSLVEFTLGLLVLLLVLAAVVDYGRLLYASIVLTNVAREGAHYGSIAPTDASGIRQAALDEYQATGLPLLFGQQPVINSSISYANGKPVSVQVTARLTMRTLLPVPLPLTGDRLNGQLAIQRTAEMQVLP